MPQRKKENASSDVRSWLRAHGHAEVARRIDEATRRWADEGKKTRRNWWDVLAGDKKGNPRRVFGIAFPVIDGARQRQVRKSQSEPEIGTRKPIDATKSVGLRAGKSVRKAAPSTRRQEPRPFVKWAGGKRQLLAAILKHIRKGYGTYHEPFLGGGAVFFAIRPPKAFLSDSNERLVRCYKGIRNDVAKVIQLLKGFKKDRDFFLKMREQKIDDASDPEVAAWFIFLNKMGFNGLYRVNSKNQFNVPFGNNKRSQIFDQANLEACSDALRRAEVEHEDFSRVEERAQPGDLVYFDPPYVPLSSTSYFTSYTVKGFTNEDQIRLRDLALRLKEKGVQVILSNSSTARNLYNHGSFSLQRVLASRAVNSKADRRGKIAELLIS